MIKLKYNEQTHIVELSFVLVALIINKYKAKKEKKFFAKETLKFPSTKSLMLASSFRTLEKMSKDIIDKNMSASPKMQ
jgi:hypothetical protein